jgi:hypothetical protein
MEMRWIFLFFFFVSFFSRSFLFVISLLIFLLTRQVPVGTTHVIMTPSGPTYVIDPILATRQQAQPMSPQQKQHQHQQIMMMRQQQFQQKQQQQQQQIQRQQQQVQRVQGPLYPQQSSYQHKPVPQPSQPQYQPQGGMRATYLLFSILLLLLLFY